MSGWPTDADRMLSQQRERSDGLLRKWQEVERERDALVARLAAVEAEREYWESRYRTQHGTLHRIEDTLAAVRAERDGYEALVRALETALFGEDLGRSRDELVEGAESLRAERDEALAGNTEWQKGYRTLEVALGETLEEARTLRAERDEARDTLRDIVWWADRGNDAMALKIARAVLADRRTSDS